MRTCQIEGCNGKHYGKGYCRDHWRHFVCGVSVRKFIDPKKCRVTNCSQPFYANNMCQKHYYREKTNGSAEFENLKNVKGIERYTENGTWCSRCRLFVDDSHTSSWCWECKKLSRYKLTKESYQTILESQEFLCPICSQPGPDHIDHDHSCCADSRQTCGQCVRGIVHKQCNAILGHVEPNLERIISYLEAGKK